MILGITFKENCPDVRNTKVVDVISSLNDYGVDLTIYDPWANEEEVLHEYGLNSSKHLPRQKFDSIVLTVAHKAYLEIDFTSLMKNKSILYDVKNILPKKLNSKNL